MSHLDFGQPPGDQFDARSPCSPGGSAHQPTLADVPVAGLTPTDGFDAPQPPGSVPYLPGVVNYLGGAFPAGKDRDGAKREHPDPVTYQRDRFAATGPQPAASAPETPEPEPPGPWPRAPYPFALADGDTAQWPDSDGGRERRGGRRWLVAAGVTVGAAVGAAAVLLTGGHPHGQGGQAAGGLAAPQSTPGTAGSAPPGASPSPSAPAGAPLTIAQAQEVFAGYTKANNSANAKRSDTLLATAETGSSFAIDAGLYQAQRAMRAAPYPPFGPAQATYYIPRDEPATGPRWFVVQVANAFTSAPAKVTSEEYLLFTQSGPGGVWRDAIEPYLIAGASVPQIMIGSDGLATAVGAGAAAVTVPPGQLPAVTAASLDGTGRTAVAEPGTLADRVDQQLGRAKLPDADVTDRHSPATGASGQEFALLTTQGGALVFYTDAAEVTVTSRAGAAFHLSVPGFYSPAQALTQARVNFLEQFAAYDPPAAGGGTPRVVADYSAITGKG